MASFEQHCRDCEVLLGDRHEAVNRWLDSFFNKLGGDHRRILHHSHGVRQAKELFGIEGAKAAVVHIVRDCGKVPEERDYGRPYSPCVELVPAFLEPSVSPGQQWSGEFRKRVEEEMQRILG